MSVSIKWNLHVGFFLVILEQQDVRYVKKFLDPGTKIYCKKTNKHTHKQNQTRILFKKKFMALH